MKNKKFTFFVTAFLSLLCVYYLMFTIVSWNVQKKANLYAIDNHGNIDFIKKQNYLDSIWKQPVWNFCGIKYTYEEVKERELNFGLDLQGGMHVTLEVSPVELIHNLAGENMNESVESAISMALAEQIIHPEIQFVQLFYKAYKTTKSNYVGLNEVFSTARNYGRISSNSSDKDVLSFLQNEIDSSINRSYEIIRARIDEFGTSQPNIQQLQGTNRIQVEFPGAYNVERIRKLLQGVAKLGFWEVYDLSELSDTLEKVNKLVSTERKSQTNDDYSTEKSKKDDDESIKDEVQAKSKVSELFSLIKGPGLTYAVKDVSVISEILSRNDVKNLFPSDLIWLWDTKPKSLKNGEQVLTVYPIKSSRNGQALLDGDVIVDARQTFDQNGNPAVSMQMNSAGTKAWKQITSANIGKQIAVSLDKDKVYSAPVVNTEIADGSSQISGSFSLEEAKDLASILKAGSLPAPVKIVEEAIIGPSLGKEAQIQGLVSMLAGLIAVILFMALYYAKGGLIANFALLFNIVFILGVLAQLNATLNLPGIAGIVLTMGMSVDANVLIFERIREELKNGLSIKKAIELGYQKAYSSIVDSNITTFLCGLILYKFGQGSVRGFATTLMIGIVSSFFSAIFITRLVIEWILSRKKDSTLSFSFGYNKNLFNNLKINFLKLRYFSYLSSAAIILIGFALLFKQGGLNLGVDFTGGKSYVVTFGKPMNSAHIKNELSKWFDNQGTEAKTYGSSNVIKITTSYMSNDDSENSDEYVKDRFINGIKECTDLDYVDDVTAVDENTFAISSSSKVAAVMAGDMKESTRKSLVYSLVVIFAYVFVRFRKWQYALASVVALVHDILVVIASFGIARAFGFSYEVDQVFVAAILTIIGYSINDTVVIFDRVREKFGIKKDEDLLTITNISINETISRTIITSMTTFISVLVLFIFAGEILRGFSFAMLIGILFGTYSSIFIAMPLVVDLSKKTRTVIPKSPSL